MLYVSPIAEKGCGRCKLEVSGTADGGFFFTKAIKGRWRHRTLDFGWPPGGGVRHARAGRGDGRF